MALIIQCPYYVYHDRWRVECESIQGQNDTEEHKMCNTSIGTYTRTYCGDIDGWKLCPYAKNLNKKYGME